MDLFHQLTTLQWSIALLVALFVGLTKAGIKGIDILAVTLFIYVFGGRASTGLLVPLLIAGDIFAVIYYRRHTQWKYLGILLPWIGIGVLLGVWFGKDLPEALFKQSMAFIILLAVIMLVWLTRKKNWEIPHNRMFGASMGIAAGFTTMVGNLAGSFSNIYFLAMRLPKNEFIGTAAWLFFIANLFKLPFHILIWKTVTKETLTVDLALLPAVIIGLLVGVRIVRVTSDHHFRNMILILTAIGAIFLFFK